MLNYSYYTWTKLPENFVRQYGIVRVRQGSGSFLKDQSIVVEIFLLSGGNLLEISIPGDDHKILVVESFPGFQSDQQYGSPIGTIYTIGNPLASLEEYPGYHHLPIKVRKSLDQQVVSALQIRRDAKKRGWEVAPQNGIDSLADIFWLPPSYIAFITPYEPAVNASSSDILDVFLGPKIAQKAV